VICGPDRLTPAYVLASFPLLLLNEAENSVMSRLLQTDATFPCVMPPPVEL